MSDGPVELPIGSDPASAPWVALETLAATALALHLSLRFSSTLVWLALPIALALALRRPLSEYGLDLRFEPPSLGTHLTLGVTLLALYALLHAAAAWLFYAQHLEPHLPGNPAVDLFRAFFVIGLPEEVFFRGYLQTRWNKALGKPWRLAGAAVGLGLVIQAVVFALCHLVTGDWTRLRVFFFALLAGWLRERSDSVLPPAVYHAVANVWYRLLSASFR